MCEEFAYQFGIQMMPAPMRYDMPPQWTICQAQISDDVENLVTDALVGEPQRVFHRSLGTENQ